jgi:hypothetical protein
LRYDLRDAIFSITEIAIMVQPIPTRLTGAGAKRAAKVAGRVSRIARGANTDGSKSRHPTLEDQLEAKAARGDRAVYTGPALDEMSLKQRHKLLYGE